MKKKFLWLAVTLLLMIAIFWFRPAAAPPAPEITPQVVVQVKWMVVQRQSMVRETTAQGTVTPLRQATVSAVQGGVIRSMRLWKNQRVQVGDALATLDLRDQQAQRSEAQALVQEARINLDNLQNSSNALAQATAEKDLRQTASTLSNAQALYRRREQLYRQGGVALKDLQDAKLAATVAQSNYDLSLRSNQLLKTATQPGAVALAQIKLQEAQLRVATLQAPLRFAEIHAPIAGTVTDQFQYLGEFVSPGTKLLSLADLSEVIVKGQFPDTVLAQLRVGQSAAVQPLDRPGLRLPGKITALGAVTDPQNRSGEVWVQLSNRDGKLRSGGFCDVVVETGRQQAVLVPDSALTLDQPGAHHGWVAVVDKAQVAHHRSVTCGFQRNGQTEVVQGLKAGEIVVTSGSFGLLDGVKVTL